MEKTLIIIPALNESGYIGSIVSGLKERYPAFDIAVVNDGSSDCTAEIAARSGAVVLNHPFRMGYGAALQTGYKYALKKNYCRVIQMDGDSQHDISSVGDLLEALEDGNADVVLGSRFLGDNGYPMGAMRRAGSLFFSKLASVLLGQRITDVTTGFQALSRKALHFASQDVFPVDYPDIDALIMLHQEEMKFLEIPVRMHRNPEGRSMHRGIGIVYYVLKMVTSVFALIYIELFYRRRKTDAA